MISSFVVKRNQASKEAYFEAIGRASQDKKIASPAEDPAGAVRLLEYDRLIDNIDTYNENLLNVDLSLTMADQALVRTADILGDVRALAIQVANASTDQNTYNTTAANVETMRDQLFALANQQTQDGRYLFSGVAEATEPFAADGSYQGSDVNRLVEVSGGTFIEGTINGAQSFGSNGEIFNPILDLVQVLNDLGAGNATAQTADADGDGIPDGLAALLDELEDAIDFSLVQTSALGGRGRYLDELAFTNEELKLHFSLEEARFSEPDLVEAFTSVTAAETTLEAVTELSSRLLQTSLLSFLR
jgi:flagellar hook-associated protein 3 FlgL